MDKKLKDSLNEVPLSLYNMEWVEESADKGFDEFKDKPKKDSKGWTDEDYAKQIVEKYNGLISKYQARLRPVKKLTPERVRLCMDIYTKFPKSEEIITALNNAVQSEYLNGKTNRRQRPAEFDWIIQPENFLKCLENNF